MIYLVVEVARIVGVGMAQAFLLRCRWLEHGRQDACGTLWREQIMRIGAPGFAIRSASNALFQETREFTSQHLDCPNW